ncbi:fungal-specific transcription factor domain-containing protein [Echria macrotheca]|uniref:Fungal-specific transcription factor domain-containing protein n=1 Tax=Echria macrotheca TaxID=438768 RepID=A0AAJ0FEN5_9PEZI|nr:fungal-specific transcription factor domain-containing protein [Echria macrotheca]
MPGARSRQGCDECRKRRRKCDEQKPQCGQCAAFSRTCEYSLRLVWQSGSKTPDTTRDTRHVERQDARSVVQTTKQLPQCLPNGIPLPPRYQRLLGHFTRDILASLSCHPSVHQDLGHVLVPAALESPQLMSACLALSAAGYLSRGVFELEGVETTKILGHLQSSGLALLRSALQSAAVPASGTQNMSETLLATCLLWCLTDVFTYRRLDGTLSSSWRIHLQGIRALLDRDGAQRYYFTASTTTSKLASAQMAMRHLHQLYRSLQTLPHIVQPATDNPAPQPLQPLTQLHLNTSPAIDGFLGYSDELLDVMRQIDQLSRTPSPLEADILLGKVRAMIARDAVAAPPVILSPHVASSPTYSFSQKELPEFTLCHQIFQQATLIQMYRRLYHHPSASPSIQSAVSAMQKMLISLKGCANGDSNMKPSNGSKEGGETMWVAMAMPVFTLGCEAFTPDQQAFVQDMMRRVESCIRSLHVSTIRQALVDVWALREGMGDCGEEGGKVCAGRLLEKLEYDIILF